MSQQSEQGHFPHLHIKELLYEPLSPPHPVPLKGSTVYGYKVGRWVTGTIAWHTESTLTVEILFNDTEPNGCLSLHESKQVITRRAGAALRGVSTTVRPLRSTHWSHRTWDVPAMEWNRPHIHTPSQLEFVRTISHHWLKLTRQRYAVARFEPFSG